MLSPREREAESSVYLLWLMPKVQCEIYIAEGMGKEGGWGKRALYVLLVFREGRRAGRYRDNRVRALRFCGTVLGVVAKIEGIWGT